MAETTQIADNTVIRNVDLKLDGFKDVFNTISTNIVAQTNMLRAQIKAEKKVAQKKRNQSEFDELKREKSGAKGKGVDKGRDDKAINDTVDRIVGKFTLANAATTLKTAAMAAAGAFVGYNILKGFINEETDGGFDNMIDGISAIGPKVQEFASFDMTAMKENFDSMTLSFGSLSTTLASLDTTLKNAKKDFDEFANNPIGQTLGFIWKNLGIISIGVLSLKAYIATQNRMARRLDLRGPAGTSMGPDDGSRSGQQKNSTTRRFTGSGRSSVGMNTPAERANLRTQYASRSGGAFRAMNGGKSLVNTKTNKIVSDAETIKNLPKQLTGKELKAFNLIKGVLTKFVAPVLLAATLIQVGMILGDPSTTEDEKIQLLAPVIGSVVGGLAGASLGAALGITVGPWGALFGGVVLGVVGALSGEALGTMIAKYAFGIMPDGGDEGEIKKATGIYAGYENMTQSQAVEMGESMSSGGVSPTPDYMKYADPNYNASSDPSHPMHTRRGGGRGSIIESSVERASYQRQKEANILDALITAERNAQEVATQTEVLSNDILSFLNKIESDIDTTTAKMSEGSVQAPTIVVNAPNVSPTVTQVQGAKTSSNLTVMQAGGGGGGGNRAMGLPFFAQ